MGLLSYIKPGHGRKQRKQNEQNVSSQADRKENASVIPFSEIPLDIPRTPITQSGSTTPVGSRPISLYPDDAFRQSQIDLSEIKCEFMVNWLYQCQLERLWTAGGYDEGVILKKGGSRGYAGCPTDILDKPNGLARQVELLNVKCAMTVNTRLIKLFLHSNDRPFVPLRGGLRLQVLQDISYLPRCQKHHFAAFIADRGIMVVWDDEPKHILDRAARIEKELMQRIWDGDGDGAGEQNADGTTLTAGMRSEDDIEPGAIERERNIVIWTPITSAVTLALTIISIAGGWAHVALETSIDHSYIRLAFALVVLPQIWLGLFFFQSLVCNIAQLIGPIAQMNINTKSYSGTKPRRLRRSAGPLPHVTIQMPVYKEGLQAVIEPTIHSIKAAISTYEMQGGTANIFVNDDGMQLISEDDARARRDFYEEHNIGWVARPKHKPKSTEGSEPFVRRGKFKKASNMNYAMWVSARVEDRLLNVERHQAWTQEHEAKAYRDALSAVVEEDSGRTWADGNVRFGDYILIIDSDTRVPTDCFLDAVSEMEQSPQVAIIQYSSGVMNVTDSFFERGITFFTNLIYTAIRYAVANGDVAPFVGHNAVLRWNALQDVAYDCKLDHHEKYWSEDTVSEDFDMALRLQSAGYTVRLGAYQGDGFKEGVSLTVYDELARWEKYAYGCSELVFHPFRYWITRGPFTQLFRNFIRSKMPFPSKLTILAYIGTYYALGSAWLLTLANYFLVGWANGWLDHYYIDSFKVYFAIIVVFTALGNVALAVLRYRIGEKSLGSALLENFSWVPLLTIFLGGVSLHVSQAIVSHLVGIDMTWGATSKEAENTTFFQEAPKIIKNFKGTFCFCFGSAVMMAVMAWLAPPLWRIDLFIAIFPLSTVILGHCALPIALNPGLMRFTW